VTEAMESDGKKEGYPKKEHVPLDRRANLPRFGGLVAFPLLGEQLCGVKCQ